MADSTISTATTAAAPSNRKVWEKSAYDVAGQTTDNSTDVGYLRTNDSRVDVVSTMDKGITQQVFSFSNLSDEKPVLSQSGANNLRIQVLNQGGQIVADSKSGQGQASQNYQALTQGTYDLKQGKYSVVVQRAPNAATDTQVAYNLQVKAGDTVNNDYITNVVPEPAATVRQQTVASLQEIAPNPLSGSNLLTASAADLFGQSGVDIFGQKVSN